MPSTEIEQFAELLVQKVRGVAIASCDSAMRPNATYPVAKRWKAAIEGGDQAALVREVIPDAVDRAVCQLLRAIDEGGLKLSFTAENGKTIDLTDEGLGELVGWYMGTGGWRAQYSKSAIRGRFFRSGIAGVEARGDWLPVHRDDHMRLRAALALL